MSWDATLVCRHCHHAIGDWNYTHSCNAMADLALDPAYAPQAVWWRQLDGMDGPSSASFLDQILDAFNADPIRFRALNPDNGWGDFDSFRKVIGEMRAAIPDGCRVKWEVSG